jgi:cytidylate kinase
MTVIAMTREMGSLGKNVALGVAEKMGLEIVHHELVERDIAGRMEVGESAVHQFLEGKPSLWDRWKIDGNKLSRYTAEEVLDLAQKGKVIIRGWGAATLLRRVPHVLCVRVCAPMNKRAQALMDRLNLDDYSIAKDEIEKNDAAHTRTIRNLFDTDWKNPLSYDLVLNTERIPISYCVDQVLNLAGRESFRETESSKKILTDLTIETQINNSLANEFGDGFVRRAIEVSVDDGVALLTGTTTNPAALEKAAQIAMSANGVKQVENNVTVINPSMHSFS